MSTKTNNTKICSKCKTKIIGRQYLNCCTCKGNFCPNIPCTQVTGKIFDLIQSDSTKKKFWKCPKCKLLTKPKNTTPTLMNIQKISSHTTTHNTPSSMSNVTYRSHKVNIAVENSFDSLTTDDEEDECPPPTIQNKTVCPELRKSKSVENLNYTMEGSLQTTLNEFTRSLDNINDLEIIQELRDEINKLKQELGSTELEIENVIIENSDLKRKNQKLSHEINILKNLCTNSVKKNTPSKKGTASNVPTQSSMIELSTKIFRLESEINTLRIKLKTAYEQIRELENKSKSVHEIINLSDEAVKNPEIAYNIQKKGQKVGQKKKLCFISDNKYHKTTQLLQHLNFDDNFNICHYITPNVGIEVLLQDIENKLQHYTDSDYGIIMIGEQDFKSTQNYYDLVKKIGNSLQRVSSQTNIILMAPLYKLGKDIYNCRVETFNKLLNYDLSAKGYGYYFDSNWAVTTDMFSEYTGRLKRNAMKQVLSQLKNVIYTSNPVQRTKKTYTYENSVIDLPKKTQRHFFLLQ